MIQLLVTFKPLPSFPESKRTPSTASRDVNLLDEDGSASGDLEAYSAFKLLRQLAYLDMLDNPISNGSFGFLLHNHLCCFKSLFWQFKEHIASRGRQRNSSVFWRFKRLLETEKAAAPLIARHEI